MANYSTNPTNPANQSGGTDPNQAPVDPNSIQPRSSSPKSIRDYVNMAREKNKLLPPDQQDPMRFTNVYGSEGYMMPEVDQQAIPEGPQSQYEKLPFAQRMKINPYIRAQERVQTFLPELWDAMFPGMQQGATLSGQQMEHWTGAVEKLTGNLLKHYDKQYAWSLKNESSQKKDRAEYRKFLHSKFIDAELRGNPPTDPMTGEPLTANEFIDKHLSVKDEMAFKEEISAEERANEGNTVENLDPEAVSEIIGRNPDIGRSIKAMMMESLSKMVGTQVDDAVFNSMMQDPSWKPILDEEAFKAIQEHGDQIMQFAK